jgi:hypothetical protein
MPPKNLDIGIKESSYLHRFWVMSLKMGVTSRFPTQFGQQQFGNRDE